MIILLFLFLVMGLRRSARNGSCRPMDGMDWGSVRRLTWMVGRRDGWTEGQFMQPHMDWLKLKHLNLVGVLVVRAQNPGVLSSGYKTRPQSSVAAQHLSPSSLACACCDGMRAGGTALSRG